MNKIVVGITVLLLAGCGSPSRVVVLQQPESKQTVTCKVDPWGAMNHARQIDKCVDAHKQAGYKVVGDSDEPVDTPK